MAHRKRQPASRDCHAPVMKHITSRTMAPCTDTAQRTVPQHPNLPEPAIPRLLHRIRVQPPRRIAPQHDAPGHPGALPRRVGQDMQAVVREPGRHPAPLQGAAHPRQLAHHPALRRHRRDQRLPRHTEAPAPEHDGRAASADQGHRPAGAGYVPAGAQRVVGSRWRGEG